MKKMESEARYKNMACRCKACQETCYLFKLRTNKKLLLFTQPHTNARKRRWLEFLCDSNFEAKQIKEKENKFANVFS
jgi:acetyl-CoA carboxylase beta subunit